MASIWGVSPFKGKVEVQATDGKTYTGYVCDMIDKYEFEEEDGVTEDRIILECDGIKGLKSFTESQIESIRQLPED